jgi:hypothetical protein
MILILLRSYHVSREALIEQEEAIMPRKGIMSHKGSVLAATRVALGLMAAALTSLTSCGGDSSTGIGPTGTTITASFAGPTMPTAVAYQAGTAGKFQTLALSDSSASFTLPSGTDAYGFAYICPTFFDVNYYSNESIIQATTADTTSLSLACPSQSGFVNTTFDASAIPGTTSVLLYVGDYSDQIYETSGSVSLSGIPTGTFDVALVAWGANGALALQIQRGVSITGFTPNLTFPPMTAADELGTAPISITGVPSSATISGFSTTYNTSGGLSVILPGPFNGLPQTTYPTAPASQSQAGDFYLIQAVADLPTQSVTAELSSNTASALTVALPSPLSSLPAPTAAAFPTFNANTSGFTVAGTVVNSTWIQYQTPSVNSTVYNLYTYVTQSWLSTNTTFTIPNLSTLTGFAPAPPSGGTEFWGLYSTAGTPLQLHSNPLEQSGIETLTSPMSVQYMQYNGAFVTP